MINPERIATAQRALGAQLARLREAAGLKQAELAARILTSRSTVANIETGHTRGTQEFWTRADEALGADGELLRGHAEITALIRRQRDNAARQAAAARATALTQVTHGPAADVTPSDGSGRSRLEARRRGLHRAVSVGGASGVALADWEQTVLVHGYATRTRPAAELLVDLESDCDELERALAGQLTSSTLRRLTVVTAQLAGLMFLTLIKLGDPGSARLWARTARVAAHEAGDSSVLSWVRAQEAYVCYYSGNLAEALAVTAHAQALGGGTACVGVPLAAALEARARAALGHRREALDALARAEAAVDKLRAADREASAFGYNEAQLRFHEGNALTHLHDTESAWQAQQRALELYPPADFLDRTLVQLDRAQGLAHAGEVLAAVEHATRAIDSLSDEQRQGLVISRGRDLWASLPPAQQALPAAREFRDLLTAASRDERGRK